MKLNRAATLTAVAFATATTWAADDWGAVSVQLVQVDPVPAEKDYRVTLENGLIRVVYEAHWRKVTEKRSELTTFEIKALQGAPGVPAADQAGRNLDGTANAGIMERAEIVRDDNLVKTVRMRWTSGYEKEVSVFPDRPWIRIDYLRYGINVVDMGGPGGVACCAGQVFVYGHENYVRDYAKYPEVYFNRYEPYLAEGKACCIDDPTPLTYNGHVIVGVYNEAVRGSGYGRIIPVSDLTILKFLIGSDNPYLPDSLGYRGLEYFPNRGATHTPYTSYVFAITEGRESIAPLGKQIIDGTYVPSVSTVRQRQVGSRRTASPAGGVRASADILLNGRVASHDGGGKAARTTPAHRCCADRTRVSPR